MQERQLLRDANIQPTPDVIAEALGDTNSAYVKFISGLKAYGVEVDWRYYNDGKAWLGKALYKWTTARGTPKEITVFWLSLWEGFFRISFYIPLKCREEALNLPLGGGIKKMLEEAKPMGKLKFFPLVFDLRSDELLAEIYTLVEFRKTNK